MAFELADGELSGIIQLGDRYVILKCEGRTKPVEVNPQEVHEILYQDIFEKKIRIAMSKKFDEIRAKARIDNYLAGTSQAPDRVRDKKPAGSGRARRGRPPRQRDHPARSAADFSASHARYSAGRGRPAGVRRHWR